MDATRFPFRRCFVTYRHAECEFIAAQASGDVIRSNSRDERLSYDAKHLIPPQAVDISVAFFIMIAAIIIGLPIARAFARGMDKRASRSTPTPEIATQLTQLNQALDAIALEVERISEGQRYATKLLSEQRDPARQ